VIGIPPRLTCIRVISNRPFTGIYNWGIWHEIDKPSTPQEPQQSKTDPSSEFQLNIVVWKATLKIATKNIEPSQLWPLFVFIILLVVPILAFTLIPETG
ncbi:MAG: hypothetical protein AAFY48_03600, partial [Bacteroidota bacterium]